MTYEQILYEEREGTAWIRLNRPERLNALTTALSAEALDAVARVEKDPEIRCLVITGEGRGFCAGQDLQEFAERGSGALDVGEHLRSGYNRLITALVELPKPVVAGVNGVAAGAGLSLALACDVRIASDAARFLQAFVKIGLVPDSGGNWLLPRAVGVAKALELSITGEQVDSAEALRIGLVTSVVPADDFPTELERYATNLAAMPTRAIGSTKRLLAETPGLTLAETLEREAVAQAEAATSEDFKEGVRAFLEKRPPRFTGR
ncbi:MAG: enoyl-CoA hydratase-related protein [Actinomycetota bacterium]|nr:enoyl-CoA hydratase-related protein [Actinomycetota bacterium]